MITQTSAVFAVRKCKLQLQLVGKDPRPEKNREILSNLLISPRTPQC